MRRRALLATVAATSVAGCLAWDGSDRLVCDEDCDIGMSADEFLPDEYETTVGETVTWKNTSTKAHTVTAYDTAIPEEAQYFASGGFDSQAEAIDAWYDRFGGRLNAGDSFSHTFDVPGEYRYYCIPHDAAGMVATVIVHDG